MTPRKMAAWLQLADRRQIGESAKALAMLRAAKTEQRAFAKFMDKLQDESQ